MKVNPTRMELRRLKSRLKTATRGHKLLKDKSDEMIRQFSFLIKENKLAREKVEKELTTALADFSLCKSLAGKKELDESFLCPAISTEISYDTKTVMGLTVPKLSVKEENAEIKFPYGFASMTSEADVSVFNLNKLSNLIIKLAEIEKTCNMLALEIERNKRRVNALEYVMIPDLEDTIKYILMKLDENERGSLTRLMKVKNMIEERNKVK